MKKILILLLLYAATGYGQIKVGDHWGGGIVVTYGQTGLMITEADVPCYKAFYPIVQELAQACRVGGYDDWRIPTVEEWSLIRELFRMYPVPKTGKQQQTGLDPYSMYCAGEEYMVSLSPGKDPSVLARTRYKTGTIYGNLRLVRTYRRGILGTLPVPVTAIGNTYQQGTVFYLSPDGQHGKVFGARLGRNGWGQANQICQTAGGRLPTIDELIAIRDLMVHYINAGVTSQFRFDGVHWSSTPDGNQYRDLIFNWNLLYQSGSTFPTERAYFFAVYEF